MLQSSGGIITTCPPSVRQFRYDQQTEHSMLQNQLDDFKMPILCSAMKWCPSFIICWVFVIDMLQNLLDNVQMIFSCSSMMWGRFIQVYRVLVIGILHNHSCLLDSCHWHAPEVTYVCSTMKWGPSIVICWILVAGMLQNLFDDVKMPFLCSNTKRGPSIRV
jgi:hypothetical protein